MIKGWLPGLATFETGKHVSQWVRCRFAEFCTHGRRMMGSRSQAGLPDTLER